MKIKGYGEAIFVPLPHKLRRDIDGGCSCAFCKAHPDRTPQWDTLGIDTADTTQTWVVHFPEVQG